MNKLQYAQALKFANITLRQFDSEDIVGSSMDMSFEVVQMVEMMCVYTKQRLIVTSGYRTVAHNRDIKGAVNSAHLKGLAVDIHCPTSYLRYKLVNWLVLRGIKRIEVGSNWVHFDIDETLPNPVLVLP